MSALATGCLLFAFQASTEARAASVPVPPPAPASPWTFASRGETTLEARTFRDDDDGRTVDQGVGLSARLQAEAGRGSVHGRARGYGRLDALDRRRTVLVPEELWLDARSARLRLRTGVDLLNWSALEAFHPADVVNARNLDSDIESLDKVGEPMAALQIRTSPGPTIEVFAFPWRSKPIFPSPASRLSPFPPGLDLSDRIRQLDAGGHLVTGGIGPQGALRLSQVVGRADLSVHLVEHVDRSQPAAALDPADGAPVLVFQTVRQLGATYQQAVGPVVIKVEGAWRHFMPVAGDEPSLPARLPDRDHVALAGGFDWTIGHRSGAESTLVAEGQALLGPDEAARRLLSPFSRAALVGWRFAANDVSAHEVVLIAVADLERRDEAFASLSVARRFGDDWTLHAAVRLFTAPQEAPQGGLASFRKASHARIALTRHF